MEPEAAAKYLGMRIKLRRRIGGLTTSQLADASGVTVEAVKAIEAGQTLAAWSDLARVASALNCDVITLLDGWTARRCDDGP
jgi:transcriptional regulator with XRE-family HTH domain